MIGRILFVATLFLPYNSVHSESETDKLYNDLKSIYNRFNDMKIISSEDNVNNLKEEAEAISNSFKHLPPEEVMNYNSSCSLTNLFHTFNYQLYVLNNRLTCKNSTCVFDKKNKAIYMKSLERYREDLSNCEDQ